MASVLPIVQAGDPVLRQRARDLRPDELSHPELKELLASMVETMRAAPGVGLAAPQVGLALRIAVVEDRPEYLARHKPEELAARARESVPLQVIINPRLRVTDPTLVTFFEGCLSVEGYVAEVARASAVEVEALDENGSPVKIAARGWYARILQHEIDHLDGNLYVDRMDTRTLTSTT